MKLLPEVKSQQTRSIDSVSMVLRWLEISCVAVKTKKSKLCKTLLLADTPLVKKLFYELARERKKIIRAKIIFAFAR